jgi:sugar phosphate isomerase/epimerase
MLLTGLVSVTFRKKTADEIIDIALKAKLDGIEWGGDVHVPPGDLANAEKIYNNCKKAGLKILSYGSYYNCVSENRDFNAVLNTAIMLNAPNIRVWAGNKNSDVIDDETRNAIINDIRSIADEAAEHSINISLECHGNTLTNTPESAVKLIREVDRSNVYLYWQPNQYMDKNYNLNSLRLINPYLSNIQRLTKNALDELKSGGTGIVNPVSGANIVKTEIYNLNGILMQSGNVQSLPKGIYLLKQTADNGKVYTSKFVK